MKNPLTAFYRRAYPCIPAVLLLWACSAFAGNIVYEADDNRVVVSGFFEERPATLSHVLAADRESDWGVMDHDETSDTFALRASLWIGSTNDWGTFFQIGRPDHPREILVLHGDLVVTAPRPNPQRKSDGRFWISNRLTLGDPDDPVIRPTVKMACSRKDEFAVRLLEGEEGWPTQRRPIIPRGELFMFNSTLTAATPDPGHTYATSILLSHRGVNFRMADSTFSWWSGDLFRPVFTAYPIEAEPRVMRGMTFENGGAIRFYGFVDCVFRGLDTALTHGGAVRSVFENNRNNLFLHGNHNGAAFLDCVIGPAERPLLVPRTRRSLRDLRIYGINRHARDIRVISNPGVVERISLPVKVKDNEGRPVPDAIVRLSCPDEPDGAAVVHRLAVTDADGLTPGVGSDSALVYTAREWRSTDDPAAPEEVTYRYLLRVQALGYPSHEINFSGDESLPRPLIVRLP